MLANIAPSRPGQARHRVALRACLIGACCSVLVMTALSFGCNLKLAIVQIDVETVLFYVLVLSSYLLFPGVGIFLVRRNKLRMERMSSAPLDAVRDFEPQMWWDDLLDDPYGFALRNVFARGERVLADVNKHSRIVLWGRSEEDQCTVCLSDFEDGDECRILRCSHVFHKHCADSWLVASRKNQCPKCVRPVCPSRDGDMVKLPSAQASGASCE